ncbi:MAG: translation initiation factor IF-3 [bacterium]|nr:translation initiation factor IF-3 [bacterium]
MGRQYYNQKRTFWRANQNIRAPKLRVIDSDGKQLGVFSLDEALGKAKARGLDLVEIAPKALPPVAKIIDFAKFKYQQEKKEREARKKEKKGTEQKEIWLSPFIADNDYTVRMARVNEFLGEGHKVRVVVRFTGRQMGHKEFGYGLLKRVAKDTKDVARIDIEPKFLGRQLFTTLAPVK